MSINPHLSFRLTRSGIISVSVCPALFSEKNKNQINAMNTRSTCTQLVRLFLTGLALTFSLTAHAGAPDPRLFGTWKCNAELSLATLPAAIPAAQRAQFATMWGSAVTTIDAQTMTSTTQGQPAKATAYEVTASDKDSVTIVRKDPTLGSQPMQFHFETKDRMWTSSGRGPMKVYYDRASK